MAGTLKQWRMRVFTATWASYAGFYFCRKNFSIVKGPLKEALNVNDFELAHIWTAYLAAYMVGQFIAGAISRKVACRLLLLCGMAISIGCNLVFGAGTGMGENGYWLFFSFMVVNGLAQATGWPGNIGAMAPWFRRAERGTVMGVWATCYQVGSFLAKAFSAAMFAWLGLAWSFWGASVVLMAVWALFYVLQRERPEDVGLPPIEEDAVEQSEEDPAGSGTGWDARTVRTIAVMGCAYFSFKFLRYAIDSWAPLLLAESFAVDTATAGLISTTFDILGFTSVMLSGFVTDRFFGGKRAPVAFVLALGMVASVIFLRTLGMVGVLYFAISLALIGFTLYGPDALLSGVGAIDVGGKRGAAAAAGVINGLGSIGALAQEEIIGYLKTHHSLDAVFVVLVIVACIGAAGTGLLFLWSRRGAAQF